MKKTAYWLATLVRVVAPLLMAAVPGQDVETDQALPNNFF